MFDPVAAEYEGARPRYPDGVFDALEPLNGARVLEGGAGTGIATRALLRRGARVVPFDIGVEMLGRARLRTPGLQAVLADAAALPFADGCADLVCFAQAWHWVDRARGCAEAARVLDAGGRWAGWWSNARADGETWFDATVDAIEAAWAGAGRDHRDIDWGDDLRESGLFTVADRAAVPWVRRIEVQDWVADFATHSWCLGLAPSERADLLDALRRYAMEGFPDGAMRVPYETWLWVATKI